MLNQVVLVGRLNKIRELIDEVVVTLSVHTSLSKEELENTRLIDCVLRNQIAKNVKEICKENDLMGIKGYVDSINIEGQQRLIIVAEKVTILSSK